MAIRQARLEALALSVFGRETMFNGWAAASGQKRINFSAGIAWFGDILNIEGPFVEIGPRSVFDNWRLVSDSSQWGRAYARPDPAGSGVERGTGEWRSVARGQWPVVSGQWTVNAKRGNWRR